MLIKQALLKAINLTIILNVYFILWTTLKKNINVSIDAEKAFDRVEWGDEKNGFGNITSLNGLACCMQTLKPL